LKNIPHLFDGTALRLTISEYYYLPSGCIIDRSNEKADKNGITPDIEVDVTIEEEVKLFMQMQIHCLKKIRRP
jgi:C-terminal processing protease CtpA/Prc